MRFTIYITLLFSVVSILISPMVEAQTFVLKGKIEGKDTGIVKLTYRNENNEFISAIIPLIQGQFHVKGSIAGVDYATLQTDTNYLYGDNTYNGLVFLEPGEITIAMRYGDFGKAVVNGSKIQYEYKEYLKSKINETNQLKLFTSPIDSIRKLLQMGLIDAPSATEQLKNRNDQAIPLRQAILSKDLSYISTHKDSYLSLMLLTSLIGRISNDSVDVLYSQLSNKVKTSSLGYRFITSYARYKKAIGQEYPFDRLKIHERAPDFAIYKNKQRKFTLDSFKGRVVLLEFWEISCLPCLQENPLIEKMRKKYKEKEFTIIAINTATIQELPMLQAYIEKNKLSRWIHLFTNAELKNNSSVYYSNLAAYYGLGVPRSILIDKNGNIVYKTFGYSPDEFQNLTRLVEKYMSEDYN